MYTECPLQADTKFSHFVTIISRCKNNGLEIYREISIFFFESIYIRHVIDIFSTAIMAYLCQTITKINRAKEKIYKNRQRLNAFFHYFSQTH